MRCRAFPAIKPCSGKSCLLLQQPQGTAQSQHMTCKSNGRNAVDPCNVSSPKNGSAAHLALHGMRCTILATSSIPDPAEWQYILTAYVTRTQAFRSTLAFFERHLGASASERYPRPAIDERRMKVLNKLVEPRGEPDVRDALFWPCAPGFLELSLIVMLLRWQCKPPWLGVISDRPQGTRAMYGLMLPLCCCCLGEGDSHASCLSDSG